MRLECAQQISAAHATPSDIEQAFDDDLGRGEFIILHGEQGDFIQAANEGNSPFTLEYHVGATDEHFQATQACDKALVRAVFHAYLQGDTAWRAAVEWRKLEFKQGCFCSTARLALAVIATAAGLYSLAWAIL